MRQAALMFLPSTIFALGLVPALFDFTDLSTKTRVVIVIVGWILSFSSMYFSVYRPLRTRARERQKPIVKLVFDELHDTYFRYTHSRDTVRINLMLVHRSPISPWRRKLKMWYQTDDYSSDERELVFPEGLGNCGKALASNSVYWYDPSKGHDQFVDLPRFGATITSDVGSVLSVPVYHPDDTNRSRPVAVLNLDSSKSVEHSGFDDPEVREIAKRASGLIGLVLE